MRRGFGLGSGGRGFLRTATRGAPARGGISPAPFTEAFQPSQESALDCCSFDGESIAKEADCSMQHVGKMVGVFTQSQTEADSCMSFSTRLEQRFRRSPSPGAPGDETNLMRASSRGDIESVYANIHQHSQETERGTTALMRAASQGHAGCAAALAPLEHGRLDQSGCNAMFLALSAQAPATRERRASVSILKAHGDEAATISFQQGLSAYCGNLQELKLCLSLERRGLGLVKDVDGSTPLHWAAKGGSCEAARFLKRYFACHTTATSKTTALMVATTVGAQEVISVLASLESGQKNAFGQTAFMMAAQSGMDGKALFRLGCFEAGLADNHGLDAIRYAFIGDKLSKELVSANRGPGKVEGEGGVLEMKKFGRSCPPGLQAVIRANPLWMKEIALGAKQRAHETKGSQSKGDDWVQKTVGFQTQFNRNVAKMTVACLTAGSSRPRPTSRSTATCWAKLRRAWELENLCWRLMFKSLGE